MSSTLTANTARPFGFLPVWRRNFLVWKKLALPSILGNLADPLIYMLGLGYGLGAMLPEIAGQSYVAFLAAGTVCASTMNAATFEALSGFRGVSIAAINGYAMGGGLECALACDLRIIEDHAQVALPEATVGLLPCAGGTQNLPRLVGEGWAKRMILCGERINVATAERIGMPFDDFIAAAQWLVAQKYCTRSKLAIMGGGLLVLYLGILPVVARASRAQEEQKRITSDLLGAERETVERLRQLDHVGLRQGVSVQRLEELGRLLHAQHLGVLVRADGGQADFVQLQLT